MKKEEKQLFRQLCSFRAEEIDKGLLQYASSQVLGHLFYNRMQAIAFGVLQKNECLGMVNREFRNSLMGACEQNTEKNRSFFQCVNDVSDLLEQCDCSVAMLKGSLLCALYPIGYRTSNDIDLLLNPNDVTVIGELLSKAGFRQGTIRNGVFTPASRREIIESKIMRGETVPYIKEVNLPYMKYLEVDINFSLDYKNSDATALKAMMEQVSYIKVNDIRIPTLCKEDFFIHLCVHLYKEATTLPWVEMKRDMTLYKYADIYMLLGDMNETEISELFKRAVELELEKITAFAILQTANLFHIEDSYIQNKAKDALCGDKNFLHRVVSPKERKTFIYRTKNITERLFMEYRAADLEEVK